MTDAEYHLTAERDELRRQVEGLRAERERWRQIPTPLTDEEREALEIAVEYVSSAFQVEHHAVVIRGLLERTAKRDTNGPRNGAADTP